MSETIQGSKSLLYSKSDIPGIPNTGDSMQHLSVQEVSGRRGAADTVIHGTTIVSSAHAIEAGSVKKKIVSTAHGAKRGWVMRPSTGNSSSEEIIITEIIDANTFAIAYEADLAIADTFDILKFITPNYTGTGDLNVVVSGSGPTMFVLDGVDTNVEEDTVVPANNTPLPSKMFIEIDGITYPVKKDTGTPANTVSVPVEITGASGPINITAGDINVQLTDLGANFDRTRIGDGTNQWNMNGSNEGLVHDSDNLVQTSATALSVASIDTKTPALVGGKVPVDTGLVQALTDTQLRATPVPVSGPLTDTQLRATPVPVSGTISTTAQSQTATFVEDQTVSTTPETFTAPAGAFAALIETDDTNTVNLRVVMGGVSSPTSGIQFQAGRSEIYKGGSNISYCSESTSGQKISVQWFIRL